VQSFYDTMPFNDWGSGAAAARAVAHPLRLEYPDLHRILQRPDVRRVAEFGCGSGWLACSIAIQYGRAVTALDFSTTALQRAHELAAAVGVVGRVVFVRQDLFGPLPAQDVDLVVSLGVLHHTGDTRRAFAHVQRAARAGGYVYVGLYHEHGRRVFLDYFAEILCKRGEDAAFARFRELAGGRGSDAEHLRSWFRDQVLHPHETLHTLREVAGWLREDGLELVSTSINQFRRYRSLDELFALELEYAERARRAIHEEERFFPGFFTVLARTSAAIRAQKRR
jgi:SAM-dependent methyltransferase